MSMIYIDRLVRKLPDVVVTPLSVHRLLLISTVVAAKFNDDVFYTSAYYAKVGGVSVQEMNKLEARFVQMLDWNLHVHPEEYRIYEDALLRVSYSQ